MLRRRCSLCVATARNARLKGAGAQCDVFLGVWRSAGIGWAAPRVQDGARVAQRATCIGRMHIRCVSTASAPTADLGGPYALSGADVEAAHLRIQGQPHYRWTPVMRSSFFETRLEHLVGRRIELFFKCEHLQATGSFKIRGALNAVLALPEHVRRFGVVTHSSGNHGQALALAARVCGIQATVVVPSNAPPVKVAAIKDYGAQVVFCEPTLAEREAIALRVCSQSGGTMIPPFDSATVMAGQGTVGLEMCQDVEGLDALVIPISGGGLIGGIAVAAQHASNGHVLVFGAEPQGADDAFQSKQAGRLTPHSRPPSATICDALRVNQLGDLCWPIVRDMVQQVFLVSDSQCLNAMRHIYGRMKQVVEPAGAVALAGLFAPRGVEQLQTRPQIRRVCVLFCGGNLDMDAPLPWLSVPNST